MNCAHICPQQSDKLRDINSIISFKATDNSGFGLFFGADLFGTALRTLGSNTLFHAFAQRFKIKPKAAAEKIKGVDKILQRITAQLSCER